MLDPVKYVPPDSGPRAKIRFVADTDSPTAVRVLGTPDCASPDLKIALLGRHVGPDQGWGRSIGIPMFGPYTKNVMTEVYIPAGRPFPMRFHWDSGYTACTVNIAFTPAENDSYEAVFSKEPGACKVEVSRISITRESAPAKVPEISTRKLC